MAPRPANVGDRLLALREDLGLSQEEAVARTDGAITLRQWQRWEKGESEPYKRNLAKLSEVFSIPIGDFFSAPPQDLDQLDRIEVMLQEVLSRLPSAEDAKAQLAADIEARARQSEQARVESEEKTPGRKRKAR